MGNMSARRLAGLSIIWGPVITVICYFIQQLVILAGSTLTDVSSQKNALVAGGALTIITSLIIPITLTMLVYGIFYILDEIRGNGNGDALVRYAKPMMLIALGGFIYANAFPIVLVNFPDMGADVLYSQWAILGISGIFFSLSFAAFFSAMGSRDDYKGAFNTVAFWVAIVAVVCSILGFVSSGMFATMTQIVGLTYLIHTAYAVVLGRRLLERD